MSTTTPTTLTNPIGVTKYFRLLPTGRGTAVAETGLDAHWSKQTKDRPGGDEGHEAQPYASAKCTIC